MYIRVRDIGQYGCEASGFEKAEGMRDEQI